MDGLIAGLVVPAAMFGLMFAMGLTLTVADFRRVFLYPRATLVGTLVQLVAMPLVGVALAVAFELPAMLAAGLVIVAACPGGVMSNMVVHLGRADVALSITLTATATAVTLFTLPLWVRAVLDLSGGAALGVEVPVFETAGRLAVFTVLPVAVGMAVRRFRPTALAWEGRLSRGSAALIVIGLTVDAVADEGGAFAESSGLIVVPVILLLAAAFVLGYGLPRALRLPLPEAATIGVEACLKNTVLGLFLATQSLAFESVLPIAFYMILQLPVSIGVIVLFRMAERRRAARPA